MFKKGVKLWQETKKIIPGGSMLYSKKAENFLPGLWPSYYTKAKGCYLWTLENKKLIDLSLMGCGTNTLGYSVNKIDNAVIKRIKKSNMSTLNCTEEVYLAKKLIKIHPWAQQVRFARSGGEANSIAIRIARSINTQKQNVAICGYGGWHDWYLAANLKNKSNLNNHLFKNLDAIGVNKKLMNTSFVFQYNNIESLKHLIKKKKIGIILMEVQRYEKPKNNFLKQVRKLCNKNKIILIFDECTTGFREAYGGIHKKYKVYPDMAMFGKAIGNGYAINAIIGKKKFMKGADKTFISSTFWTEAVGSTAALHTLDEIKRTKSWKKICKLGKYVKKEWFKLSKKYNLDMVITGLDSIPRFEMRENFQVYRTFITKKLLEKKILSSNYIYLSTAHNKKIIDMYIKELDKIFQTISYSNFDTIYKQVKKNLPNNVYKK